MNFILTSSPYQYHHLRHHSHVITTSESLICHMTTTSSHHHGTYRSLSKDLVWASSRVFWRPTKKTTLRSTLVLEFGVSNLIKGKCPWLLLAWLKESGLDYYNKKTTEEATNELVREDGWPDAAWPNSLRRQHQLQLWTIILLDE